MIQRPSNRLYVQLAVVGGLWRSQIGNAIRGCEVVVFVLSKRSVASRYCMEEVCVSVSET